MRGLSKVDIVCSIVIAASAGLVFGLDRDWPVYLGFAAAMPLIWKAIAEFYDMLKTSFSG